MKQLSILILVLTSFSSVFAMSEKTEVSCSKMNQESAYQENTANAPVKKDVKVEADKSIRK